MTDIRESILFLQASLRELETNLIGGDRSSSDLEDFKSTLDTVRTTVLAALAASGPSEYKQYVRRFRLRRATQVCQGVLFGLLDGTITVETPGIGRLRATIADTLPRLEANEDLERR